MTPLQNPNPLTSGSPDPERAHKQAIILRKDLNMRKGKMIAQGSHASMAAVLSRAPRTEAGWLIPSTDTDIEPWLSGRFAKIALGCDSEQELLTLHELALSAGLPCALIRDAGLTEFGGVPTLTAVAIGPAEKSKIDQITQHLKLL
jgi:PTH2 family peptidyl-tRNA hydrolase